MVVVAAAPRSRRLERAPRVRRSAWRGEEEGRGRGRGADGEASCASLFVVVEAARVTCGLSRRARAWYRAPKSVGLQSTHHARARARRTSSALHWLSAGLVQLHRSSETELSQFVRDASTQQQSMAIQSQQDAIQRSRTVTSSSSSGAREHRRSRARCITSAPTSPAACQPPLWRKPPVHSLRVLGDFGAEAAQGKSKQSRGGSHTQTRLHERRDAICAPPNPRASVKRVEPM